MQVHKDQLVSIGLQLFERFLSIGGNIHYSSLVFQHSLGHQDIQGVVLHQQQMNAAEQLFAANGGSMITGFSSWLRW